MGMPTGAVSQRPVTSANRASAWTRTTVRPVAIR